MLRFFLQAALRLHFKARSCKAYVVDRRLFDRALALDALREGAELRLCSSVRKMRWEDKKRILTLAGGEEVEARIVISAEGVRARLARQAGIMPPRITLSGAQVEVPFAVEDPESVELHLGPAPGLFAWVIPTGEETARIGLCARERGCEHLRAFLKTERIRKRILGSATTMNVGGLPLGLARGDGRRGPAGGRGRSRPGQAHLRRRHLSGSCRGQDRRWRSSGCGL